MTNVHPSQSLCSICGGEHPLTACPLIAINAHIPDAAIPPKAFLTIPNQFRIERMSDNTYAIIANVTVAKGTVLGPLEAEKFLTLDPSVSFPLKLFLNDAEDFSEYYLDTTNEQTSNWMIFIPPAQVAEEQNLICYQDSLSIYYVTTREICRNEFLKVWYAPQYARKMKKLALSETNTCDNRNMNEATETIDVNELIKRQQKIMIRETWTCKFCGKIDKNVAQFAQHIQNHYRNKTTGKRQIVCQFCGESFRMSDIKKHLKKVHPLEMRNKGGKTSSFAHAPIAKDSLVGGPLLNNLLNDGSDNTSLLFNVENRMDAAEHYNFDPNVETMEQFNFEIDDAQEQHVCDICLKQFTKLKYLILHLDQHTGRLLCKKCLKVFSRKKTLDFHACADNQPDHVCPICTKAFFVDKHLRRHISHVHERKHACAMCAKRFATNGLLQSHCCPHAVTQHAKFACETCNKSFTQKSYLRRHVKIHASVAVPRKRTAHMQLVCEVCGFVCTKLSRFERHRGLQHRDATVTCDTCSKSCVTAVDHADTSTKTKPTKRKHKCHACAASFDAHADLAHHRKTHHSSASQRCATCKKVFDAPAQMHGHECAHKCHVCPATFVVRQSLNKHVKQQHGTAQAQAQSSKEASVDAESVDSIAINIEHLIEDFKTEKSKSNASVLDFNELALEFGSSFTSHLNTINSQVDASCVNADVRPSDADGSADAAKDNAALFLYIYSEGEQTLKGAMPPCGK